MRPMSPRAEPGPAGAKDAIPNPSRPEEGSVPIVGVTPGSALRSHGRLLRALERAEEVRFVASEAVAPGHIDAALVFPEALEPPPMPERLPCHVMTMAESRGSDEVMVSLSRDPLLPRPVHGQLLREAHAPFHARRPPEDVSHVWGDGPGDVLAQAGEMPVWEMERGRIRTRSLLSPSELDFDEPLRERLRSGRFLALLPVVWFLRSLHGRAQWCPPPLRASFIFDDPNLHALTYGFIDFRELAAWTRRRGTHVTFAMVPLDGRFAASRAVELFRREPGLSLMIHGNNHIKRELDRNWRPEERLGSLEQALDRIVSFERRTRVSVSKVMAPPHGHCAEASADAMRVLGFEALCASNPYPWLLPSPPDRPLAGWGTSEIVAGGLPVLPRLPLERDPSELVFRALLGQPLIVYGHHGDVREGLDQLDSHTDAIERLDDDVSWCSLEEIARSNYTTRAISDGLELRPYSRLVEFAVPEGCAGLRVSPPPDGLDLLEHPVRWRCLADGPRAWQPVSPGEAVPVRPGDRLQLALGAPAIRPGLPPSRLWAAGALARRFATELRDRMQPVGRSAPRDR
jgi:hypothetical protein